MTPSDSMQRMTVSAAYPKGLFRPGFDVRIPLMGIFAGATDVGEFYDVPTNTGASGFAATNNAPSSSLAWASGLGLDYGWSNGFVAGVDLLYGPNRFNTVTNTLSYEGNNVATAKDDYAINEIAFMITPGWRFKVGNNMIVEPRLGLSIMETSMVQTHTDSFSAYGYALYAGSPVSNTAGIYSATSSGLGYAIWPEIRGEYLFGQFGVGFILGYLLTTPTPQKYTGVSSNMSNLGDGSPESPNPSVGANVVYQSSPSSTTPTRWYLQTDGLSLGIFISYHFQPVFW